MAILLLLMNDNSDEALEVGVDKLLRSSEYSPIYKIYFFNCLTILKLRVYFIKGK